MLLLLKIEQNHSADAVMVDNVTSYLCLGNGMYGITYKDPNKNNQLFDIVIKHVAEIKEVRL